MEEIFNQVCGVIQNVSDAKGLLDYILVAIGAIVVLLVLVFTVKFLVWPGERSPRHIKNRILQDNSMDSRT